MPNTGSVGISGKITGTLSKMQNVTGVLSVPTQRISSADYNELRNKPTINGLMIEGDKVSSDYKLQHEMNAVTQQDIDNIIYGGN